MADLKKTIEILFEGNDQASRKAADVLGKIREMETQAKATTGGTDSIAKSLDDIGRKDVVIARAADAMKALAAGLVVDRFIEANIAVEKFERGIKAVAGASVDTGAELAYVTGVADRLGIQLFTATDGYLKLTAATKGTALEGQATRNIFEAVSLAMSALSRSGAETAGAFRSIEQIAGKGKVQMEEVRGQLAEHLPGAMQIAARAMGTTVEGFEKLVKAGLDSNVFLERLDDELNRTFAGAKFDGYVQSMARLRNTIDQAFVDAGKAGAFDALISGVNVVTATITGSISFIRLFGETIGNLAYTAASGDFSGFGARFGESVDRAANSTKSLTEALAGVEVAATKAATASNAIGKDIDAQNLLAFDKALEDTNKKAAEGAALLKTFGVDPHKTTDAIAKMAADLEKLATNPTVNGHDWALAFEGALKRATSSEDVSLLGGKLATLFNDGKISAKAYTDGLDDLEKAFGKVDGSQKKTKDSADESAKALARQAAETKKAEENAQKFTMEMEKLASNERIKFIEAKVTLNIAEVEAQTKRVEAAFESINTTITSSGDLLGDLFSNFKEFDGLSFRAEEILRKQIDSENAIRSQAVAQQKALIDAQVAQLRAQTRALEKGDSIIKVDGAGLQPHLEAFMWEILRTIQVRVNQDGLKMLLGV